MDCFVFDSRSPACKTPFGAVPAGTIVTLQLYLPKGIAAQEVWLLVFPIDEQESQLRVPMALAETALTANRYCCEFTPQSPALFSYGFEVLAAEKRLWVCRSQNGQGVLASEEGPWWQLTVYDAGMKTPAVFGDGILYQIFPDRFAASGTPKPNVPSDRTLHQNWGDIPEFRPNEQGTVTNSDYFGGDLAGITQKLPYLASLGVSCLYLNPIFEAHSNHRYNTADYRKIDPLLGCEEDFAELCRCAAEHGISVILDGVFSHTGSDSLYFNKENRYEDSGAFWDQDSPFFGWYRFEHWPDKYDSWWGFPTLPNVQEENPAYLDFICGENGVLEKWMKLGAAGWRLDVADELPDVFLDALYQKVKALNPEAAVIGEVWEDASNKQSYGVRRRYLLGRQMDSVMNYPFKDALLGYIRYGEAELLQQTLLQVLENYPEPVWRCLMNSLSTHDTLRAITALAGKEVGQHDREWQLAHHFLSKEEHEHGVKLFALCCILQFGLPGIPCLYYGDEVGVVGYADPFNRTTFPWGEEHKPLTSFVAQLGQLRRRFHNLFAHGTFAPIAITPAFCCFEWKQANQRLCFAVNRSDSAYPLPLPSAEPLVVAGDYHNNVLGAHSGIVFTPAP